MLLVRFSKKDLEKAIKQFNSERSAEELFKEAEAIKVKGYAYD